MSMDKRSRSLASGALLLGVLLGGCATSTAGSSLMDARAEATAFPKSTGYLPVDDLPPRPEKPAMTADALSKLKKELIAARDRQASKAREGAASPRPIKP
jgi:hypothetical protein